MKYNVNTNSGITVTTSMRDYVENYVDSLQEYMEPIFGKSIPTVNTAFKKVKDMYHFEINIAGRLVFRTTAGTENFYDSVDIAFARMKKNLRRYAKRLQDKRKRTECNMREFVNRPKEYGKVIREKEIHAVAMSEETAIQNLEQLDHDFFLYLDKITLQPCIVYRRVSEGYGVLKLYGDAR